MHVYINGTSSKNSEQQDPASQAPSGFGIMQRLLPHPLQAFSDSKVSSMPWRIGLVEDVVNPEDIHCFVGVLTQVGTRTLIRVEAQMAKSRHPAIQTGRTGLTDDEKPSGFGDRMTDTLMNLISKVPSSSEISSAKPDARARQLARNAARTSASISGGAALAPGPLGMLTLLPDLVGVWKVQAQMVADIAATYGKTATLTQEQMVYCLFKHTAAQLLRDVIVREGGRYLVLPASMRMLRSLATKIGIKVGQRSFGKAIARYAPLVGALGVGAYAYYDTQKVADTAIALFSSEVVVQDKHPDENDSGHEHQQP